MKDIKNIENKIHMLSPRLLEEVEDFIDFLISKKQKNKNQEKRLKQDWAGALSEFSNQYSSVELQKKALEWRKK
jgi:galactose-1-phosphate uridylyltransferase